MNDRTMDSSARPLTRLEWTSTLAGLGLVIGAAVLIESAPRGDYAQIMLILGAAMAVSVTASIRSPTPGVRGVQPASK